MHLSYEYLAIPYVASGEVPFRSALSDEQIMIPTVQGENVGIIIPKTTGNDPTILSVSIMPT